MVKPYSNDLGERLVGAGRSGDSCRKVAARFGVAVSTVVKWRQRFQGSVAPPRWVAPGS